MVSIIKEKRIDEILDFWFGCLKDNEIPSEAHRRIWWIKNDENDKKIKDYFEKDLELAIKGDLEDWELPPKGTLALIIILDQFSRNIYRDTERAFSQDTKAVEICIKGIENGVDNGLPPVQRIFFYMPLMHSEDMGMQEKSMECYINLKKLVTTPPLLTEMISQSCDFAQRHYAIIKRFGRYPHRNLILGRQSTPEEIRFLTEPGSSF
ncbi:MAG: DUF924 domain-containing protein [Candidatus Dadabacteria bacterium]|nr:DUF924 domain-containing protein [Candidatus Dadabacteria bacterium]